jgi:hypothetical protein
MKMFTRIKGFENYIVFKDGSVFNVETNRYLKARINEGGYKRLDLFKGKFKRSFYVHRLVALNFIPSVPGKEHVHHIDHISSNNHVNNLMWVDIHENNKFRDRKAKGLENDPKEEFWEEAIQSTDDILF